MLLFVKQRETGDEEEEELKKQKRWAQVGVHRLALGHRNELSAVTAQSRPKPEVTVCLL